MGLFSKIVSVAAPIVGSFFGGERRNESAEAQSAAQMAFQERMSNTSYQRAVKDMQAAGLNPMLAYKLGGATTPTGAMAPIQDTISPAIEKGINAYQVQAQVQNTHADTVLKESQAELNSAQKAEVEARTQDPNVYYEKAQAEIRKILADANLSSAQYNHVLEAIDKTVSEDKLIKVETGNKLIDQQILALQLSILNASSPNDIGFEEGPGGKIRPYLKSLVGPASSAAGAFFGARVGRGGTSHIGPSGERIPGSKSYHSPESYAR